MEDRNIQNSWIKLALENYDDFQEVSEMNNMFLKTISENKNRCLIVKR